LSRGGGGGRVARHSRLNSVQTSPRMEERPFCLVHGNTSPLAFESLLGYPRRNRGRSSRRINRQPRSSCSRSADQMRIAKCELVALPIFLRNLHPHFVSWGTRRRHIQRVSHQKTTRDRDDRLQSRSDITATHKKKRWM
jgi:hypothetical protein